MEEYDVLVVGAGPSGSAAAKKCMAGGLKTLLIERMKLPRRKACSGIITNVSQNYVFEHFGPIPKDVFGKPYISKGMAFHFPSTGTIFADVDCYNLYVWRDKFDYFLATSSGAKVQDETSFINVEQKGEKFEITLKSKTKKRKVRVKYLIGADGGHSRVTRRLAPEVFNGQRRVWAAQKYYEGKIEANEDYLYWMMEKGFGPMPWLNLKDDQIIIGLALIPGYKFADRFQAYLEFLKKNFGLKIKREIATEGCYANMGTTINNFFPGRGNVLMVGDACGFVNMGHCSISSGLVSGTFAGEAIIEALNTGTNALELYKKLVEPEMTNTLDQWNPFRMLHTAGSGRYRQPAVLHGHSFHQRMKMLSEILGFVSSEFTIMKGILPKLLMATARRTFLRKYKIGIMD